MIRNSKYFLLALLASVLFNSCFVVEKQTVETSSKESYTLTQPSVSEVRSTSTSTETDLADYSYLDGSWYEDTLHEKSNLRDYFYRIKGNQISVVDKKHNKKETFFGFSISNGKVTISSKGEDSKKIAPGTYPISIKSENQFTISFAKPMSFIRNTYAHDQAEAFVEKATDISLGAGAISGLSGALDMGVQTAIGGVNDASKKAAVAAGVAEGAGVNNAHAKEKNVENLKEPPEYGRPAYAPGQVEEVWLLAPRNSDGKVYCAHYGDPLSISICSGLIEWVMGTPRIGIWDMGHKPGHEYRTLINDYRAGMISNEQFWKEYYNPLNYEVECIYCNRSHLFED